MVDEDAVDVEPEALAAEVMTQLPQVLVNVRVARRDPGLVAAIAADITASASTPGTRKSTGFL